MQKSLAKELNGGILRNITTSECSSAGRASRCQRDCRRFDSGHSLHLNFSETKYASVAQLVEHHVANVIVAGSNPVTRSIFFCRNGRGNTGLAPRRLQSRTYKSAPSPPRIAKPEFPTPIFGKKCRLIGKVRGLLLGGFSHGRTVRSFAPSCRKTRISHAHFRQKVSVVWQSPGLAPRRLQSRTYSPLLRSLMSQNSNFPRPLSAKRVGWYGYGTGHGCVVEPLCATLTRGARP